jgi:hypothetical protein
VSKFKGTTQEEWEQHKDHQIQNKKLAYATFAQFQQQARTLEAKIGIYEILMQPGVGTINVDSEDEPEWVMLPIVSCLADWIVEVGSHSPHSPPI